jgi:hypothetical protein
MTPHGGLGMNTAIQSAHNLAWKLAGVLRGWAGPELLDTYEIERREAGRSTVDLSYRLFNSPVSQAGNVLGHVLGAAYPAGALIPDGSEPPTNADPVGQYVPTARPGHRAPHLWLHHGGGRISTLDLFGSGFVLLSRSSLWTQAARRVASSTALPVDSHLIVDPSWSDLYEVGDGGAVMVRPDGYVAWRTARASVEPEAELAEVLAQVTGLKRESTEGVTHGDPTEAAYRV